MSELMVALAYLFRRKGGQPQQDKDLIHAVTFDLRWFGAAEAKAMLDAGLDEGLIVREGDRLKPNFDIKSVTLPIMHTPTEKFVAELRACTKGEPANSSPERAPVFPKVLARLSEKTGMSKTDIMREINRKKEKLNMDIEVVGLIIARKHGIDISDLIGECEAEILSRARE